MPSKNKLVFALVAGLAILPQYALANSNWKISAAGDWGSPDNWSAGVPGSTSSTNSTDWAYFGVSPSNGNFINIDSPSQNIGNIGFSGGTQPFTIGSTSGNSLLLSDGGEILDFMGSGTSVPDIFINAPLTLEGSYSVQNISTNSVVINGTISGSSSLTFSGGGYNGSGIRLNGDLSSLTGYLYVSLSSQASNAKVSLTNVDDNPLASQIIVMGDRSTFYTTRHFNSNVTFYVANIGNGENLGSLRLDSGATVDGRVQLTGSSGFIGTSIGTGTITGTVAGAAQLTKVGLGTLVLSGKNITHGTNVKAGTLSIANAQSLPTNQLLNIFPGALLTTAQMTTPAVLEVRPLYPSGTRGAWTSKLDLADNDLVDHVLSTQSAATILADLTDQLKFGFNLNQGYWNGAGGIFSSTAAGDPTHLHTIGILQNINSAGDAVAYSTFHGVSGLSTTDMLLKYTVYGDADLDGNITSNDYSLIDVGFNSSGSQTGWVNGDFNYDGKIDGSDYSLIDNAFNRQSDGTTSAIRSTLPTAETSAALPEPAAAILLFTPSFVLLTRRKNSRSARQVW